MKNTGVMTLRLPKEVKRGVERLATRSGHKPAQLGARLIEEGLRRRDHPQIDLRETPSGRVAYLAGTRMTVYWILAQVTGRMKPEAFARDYDISPERIRAALAYAQAFPDEIESDRLHSETNRKWVEQQDVASRLAPENGRRKGMGK